MNIDQSFAAGVDAVIKQLYAMHQDRLQGLLHHPDSVNKEINDKLRVEQRLLLKIIQELVVHFFGDPNA